MGEVYRADDLKLDEPVALKFLPEPLAQDEGMLARFYQEVKVARRVTHPNVCRVYDVGEVDGHHFLSMEFIDGEDLASRLRRSGRPRKREAMEILRQVCRGLAAIHDQGILHCDLKPANLLLDGQGRTRITDFGVARLAGRVSGTDRQGGTPAYMAPEQHAGEEVSTATDIYALGLVSYELTTGERAFRAGTAAELARLHRETPPRAPSSLVADFDPALERVILKCLAKDPRERPASVADVTRALGRSGAKLETELGVEVSFSVQALRQLPPPPADFTGRAAELSELMAAVQSGGVTISGLQGMGGVGKTTLASRSPASWSGRQISCRSEWTMNGPSAAPRPIGSRRGLKSFEPARLSRDRRSRSPRP
jgi:serine/threonine protein kinase